MRELTSHKVNGLNEALKVFASDEPGPGGASHSYTVYLDEANYDVGSNVTVHQTLQFQNGPITTVDGKPTGMNGISNESLLAIVEDRLKGFQAGPFGCRENALALTHLQESMHWLHHRTRERVQRGVEGTLQK